jgi:glycine dehydrogenase subunit 1
MNYGGPFLGVMGSSRELMRKLPGRIAGEARDGKGKRGYVLTLSAREQHIRRERAVSNICSNQGLSMLRSCIYLALMGRQGLRLTAELCWHRAHYTASQLALLGGKTQPLFSVAQEAGGPEGTFFKEFTVELPQKFSSGAKSTAHEAAAILHRENIVPGLPLSRYFPENTNALLVCVTENNSKSDIDRLVKALGDLYL